MGPASMGNQLPKRHSSLGPGPVNSLFGEDLATGLYS